MIKQICASHNLEFINNSNRQSNEKLSSAEVAKFDVKVLGITEINSNKRTCAACSGD